MSETDANDPRSLPSFLGSTSMGMRRRFRMIAPERGDVTIAVIILVMGVVDAVIAWLLLAQ